MDDPDVIALVHRDADRRAEHPMVRQRLRPERIDLEVRRLHRVAALPCQIPGNDESAAGGEDEQKTITLPRAWRDSHRSLLEVADYTGVPASCRAQALACDKGGQKSAPAYAAA